MHSSPPTYPEFDRIQSGSPHTQYYQSMGVSSISLSLSGMGTPIPSNLDTDGSISTRTAPIETVSPSNESNSIQHSCSSIEQTHEFILPPPPYPFQTLNRSYNISHSQAEPLLNSSTIILDGAEEHHTMGHGISSLGATFYYTSVVSVFKLFLFIFHIVNIVVASINFHSCPYLVGNVISFIPAVVLFIHCFGVFHLAVKLWNAWTKLCKTKDSSVPDMLSMQEKCFWLLDKLYLCELLVFLPLYTILLLSLTFMFLYATPDFSCSACIEFCDPFFFRFSSVSTELYAVLGVIASCISYFLILVRFCSRGLIQVIKLFFLKSNMVVYN